MPDGIVLGFDFGIRRIGVAVGETMLRSTRPLMTIDAEANAVRFAAIDKIVRDWQPLRLVVGLPLASDAADQELSGRCRRFARQLGARFSLPVDLVDERFSSLEAESRLRERGRDVRQARQAVDAEAAAVILQTYFERENDAAFRA